MEERQSRLKRLLKSLKKVLSPLNKDAWLLKAIVLSLIIPSLLIFLENHYKIVSTLEQDRQLSLREKRLESIALTARMWNELFALTNEVIYYSHGSQDPPKIGDILRSLRNFTSSAEDVVNMWHFSLNIPDKHQELSLVFLNALLHCTETVADAITGSDQEESRDLQQSLGVIQDGIKTVAHHPIMNLLKRYADLKELQDADNGRKQQLLSLIQSDSTRMHNWAREIKRLEIRYNQLLPTGRSEKMEALRTSALKLEARLRANREKPETYKAAMDSLLALMREIPHREFINAHNLTYSKDFVKHLADWLGREAVTQKMIQRAQWPE